MKAAAPPAKKAPPTRWRMAVASPPQTFTDNLIDFHFVSSSDTPNFYNFNFLWGNEAVYNANAFVAGIEFIKS